MTAGRAIVPKIRVPDDGLGPCMSALSPGHRAYVVARVFYGLNQAKAAKAAGYAASTKDIAKVSGYRLEHDEAIQAAIGEECRKLMRAEGAASIRTLISVRDDTKTGPKDRIKAAESILNRCGLGSVAESHVTVEHKLSPEQMDRRILELARELGIADAEARKLLVAPDAIEGEFEIVKPDPTPEQAERAERYRATNERAQQSLRRSMTPEELAAHKRRKREERAAKAKSKYEAAQRAEDDLADILAPMLPGEFGNEETP